MPLRSANANEDASPMPVRQHACVYLLRFVLSLGCGVAGQTPSTAPSAARLGRADVRSMCASNNAFALDLYDRLRERPGNLAFSPASISAALAMTYAGARGDTAAQMREVMHIDLEPEALHEAWAHQLRAWGHPTHYELAVANRLFAARTLELEAAFLQLTRERYGADAEAVSFAGAPEAARTRINAWVAKHTDERIRRLLPVGSIGSDTRLVLASAVYFEAKWRHAFSRSATADDEFFAPSGTVTVPMMALGAKLRYTDDADVQVLELPYEGSDFAMIVILPRERDGLPAVEDAMTSQRLGAWMDALASVEVMVRLPRFELEPEPIALADELRDLGMERAFSNNAEFDGMTADESVRVDGMHHQAWVEVDEEGTKAAAATGVRTLLKSSRGPERVWFVADHPFVFAIRDVRSGALLFLGRVENPR